VVTYVVGLPSLHASWKATVRGNQAFEVVVTPSVVETIMGDSQLRRRFMDMLEAENAEFFVIDEQVPLVMIADEVVGLCALDDERIPRGLILSEDEHVFEWAVDTWDAHRSVADPLNADVFTT
jgi:predicted transcriptional regulator